MEDVALVIRSGGLGDFVLTLPLLQALRRRSHTLRVLTRPSYAELLPEGLADQAGDVESAGLHRLAAGSPSPSAGRWLARARVHVFANRPDQGFREAALAHGAREVCTLEPRPSAPPHVSLRMLHGAGLDADPLLLERPPLAREGHGEGVLWLHPGSGSASKNARLEGFAELARAWGEPVVVSLGEAELALLPRYRRLFERRTELLVAPTLAEFRARLEREACAFVGNDSGPTHLAAALGVPTAACFVRTDPAIWRPLGRRVQLLRDPSELDLELLSRARAGRPGRTRAPRRARPANRAGLPSGPSGAP